MHNKKNIAGIVSLIACIILIIILAVSLGWIDFSSGKIVMGDYSVIPVSESEVEVTDTELDELLEQLAENDPTTETITEGTLEEGDTITYDYSGVLDGETEPFEGGTAENQTLTLGSGTMIDGFEDGIIGHEIGETFTIGAIFPDEYSNAPDLAGKVAIFTITVHFAQREVVHEVTDEWAKEYTDIVLPNENINNIEEFKAYLKEYNYNQRLESAMMVYLSDITEVKSYDGKTLRLLKEMAESTLDNYAASGNSTIDEVAQEYGYSDAGEYEDIQAKAYLKAQMIYDKILEDKGITYTQKELDEAFDRYLQDEGYEDYNIEEFREKAGEAWCWVYENCKFKRSLALDAVKGNVEVIEEEEESAKTSEVVSNDKEENSSTGHCVTMPDDSSTAQISNEKTVPETNTSDETKTQTSDSSVATKSNTEELSETNSATKESLEETSEKTSTKSSATVNVDTEK